MVAELWSFVLHQALSVVAVFAIAAGAGLAFGLIEYRRNPELF